MSQPNAGALDGLRVLDLTRILAGPLCTMMLGDMGADVVKVEPPQGDDTRAWGPPFAGTESAYYLAINRNKRSMTLNMAVARGQEILAGLILQSDVLVENFKLGTLARWGFDDAWFEQHAPQLVRCSITGYGSTGDKAAQPGYDFVMQAESGLMSICGNADGAPTRYGVAIVDVCTGMLALSSILAALRAREKNGKGQKVEVSLFESSLAMLVNIASNFLTCGKEGSRFGNSHPSIVPYTTYATADGMLALAVGNDTQFAKCAQALEHPEWAKDERYIRNRDRVAHREQVDGMIGDVFKTAATDIWLRKLEAAGVPCGRLNSISQALQDPQAVARNMVEAVDHPTLGALKVLGTPFKFGETPTSIRMAPPLLGQHTEEILQQKLGYSTEQIADLRQQRVL